MWENNLEKKIGGRTRLSDLGFEDRRQDMSTYEMIIRLPNQPGQLSEISELMGSNNIDIRAMDISLIGVEGILSLVVDNHSRGVQLFRSLGFEVREREVIAVWVPDHPGGLNTLLKPLREAQIGVERLYLASCRKDGNTLVILEVTDIDASKQTLASGNVNIVETQDSL